MSEQIDLYGILGVTKSASKAEIKKAYHRGALANHPDKVAEEQRGEAEIRFKAVSQAYEILYDDDTRQTYDQYGMAAFEKGGMGGPDMSAGVDINDILSQMFGMSTDDDGVPGMSGFPGMGGMPGMGGRPGGGPGARVPRRGPSEEQKYNVTLEDLYNGKTAKFSSTKDVNCATCKGSGGKENAKPKTCETCKGQGVTTRMVQVGPGLVSPSRIPCTTCSGAGQFYRDKDRCKKCKGARVVQQKKMLELYIPPGSRSGERIILSGEADQRPGQEPGDLVFELEAADHDIFTRAGPDLAADVNITLAEALTGVNRVLLKHLDGRGILVNTQQIPGKILRPSQILKLAGEGMPIKRSETKGDLYLRIMVDFPKDGFFSEPQSANTIKEMLPGPAPPIIAEVVDEPQVDLNSSLEEFGAGEEDGEWEDEEGEGGAQCAQQ